MSRIRVVLLAVLAATALAWAYSASSQGRSAAVRAARAAQAARPMPAAFDLEVRQDRLDGRAVVRPELRRNPFRFAVDLRASRDPQPARAPTPAAISTAASAPISLPVLSLIGIVDRTVGGKPIRVAVVSTADGPVFASVGDRVTPRYEVTSLTAEAMELKDLTDGSTRRLAMK